MAVPDFPLYGEENNGATAASIREAAAEPSTHTATINALVTDLSDDQGSVRSQIEGDVADIAVANPAAATQTAQNLARNGFYAIGLINQFADAVETYDATVTQLNEELRQNTQSQWRAQRSGDDRKEAGAGGVDDITFADVRQQEKAKLQGRFNDAVRALDTAETTAVTGFEGGPPSGEQARALVLAGYIPLGGAGLWWPAVSLTPDEQRQALSNMTAEAQADYVRNRPDIPPELASVISAGAQELLSRDVVGDIKNSTVDQDTVRLLTLFNDKPAFAAGVFQNVTPNEVADVIKSLNSAAFTEVVVGSKDPNALNVYGRFMDAAGLTLATYSRHTTNPTMLADQYFQAITTDDPRHHHNAAALTLLMREAGEKPEGVFGTTFMDKLATDIYQWERRLGANGDPVWGDRNAAGIVDPDTQQSGDLKVGRVATDGLANILGAMGHSPEAAQAFFKTSDGHVDAGMLDYLIGKKDGSDVDARTFTGSVSDEGEGLGLAMQAASIGGGEGFDQKFAAQFTTDVFRKVADLSGHDGEWHVWEKMTDDLGAMASGYTHDVYDILNNSVDTDTAQLGIDTGQLQKLLGEIGRGNDKTGLTLLTTAMLSEVDHRSQLFLDGMHGPKTMDALHRAGFPGLQTEHGDVMGQLLKYGVQIQGQEEAAAKEREKILSRALDAVAGFVPGGSTVLGEGASQLAKMAFDTGKGQLVAEIKEGLETKPTTEKYLAGETDALKDKLTYGAMGILARNGYLGPQEIPGRAPFPGIPPEILTGDPPQIRPDLYDKDGYIITDKNLSDEERRKIQDAWNDFRQTSGSPLLTELTYQSSFMEQFIKASAPAK